MTAQLTKIRGSQAQAIICWGTNPGPAVIARNAKQLGIKMPLYMSHGVSSKKFIELAGDAAEGIMLPSGRVHRRRSSCRRPITQKKSLLAYVKDYKKHYKAEGDHFGGHAWDAVMLLKGAHRAGRRHRRRPSAISWKRPGILPASAASSTSPPQDHAGLTKDAFVLVEIKNKDWVLVK